MNKIELLEIEGGINLSGALINSFSRLISIVKDLGRSLGGAIRRFRTGRYCKL